MRIFIAIPLPKPTIHQLVRASSSQRPKITSGVRWVPPENLHLTLRFLGETSPEVVSDLTMQLDALGKLPSFDLAFTEYGVFPKWNAPTSIWLGVNKTDDLLNIHRTVELMVRDCGFRADKRPFTPHLTVVRVKRNPSSTTVSQIQEAFKNTPSPVKVGFPACHVVLFQSILSPQGSQYNAIHTVDLKQT